MRSTTSKTRLTRWTLAALLVTSSLAASGARASASSEIDCQTATAAERVSAIEARGFVCPGDLPKLDLVQAVCAEGCYIFAPDKAARAEADRETAELVGDLRLKTADLAIVADGLRTQRDKCTAGYSECLTVSAHQTEHLAELTAELERRPTWLLVVSVGLGALGLGIFAGLVGGTL